MGDRGIVLYKYNLNTLHGEHMIREWILSNPSTDVRECPVLQSAIKICEKLERDFKMPLSKILHEMGSKRPHGRIRSMHNILKNGHDSRSSDPGRKPSIADWCLFHRAIMNLKYCHGHESALESMMHPKTYNKFKEGLLGVLSTLSINLPDDNKITDVALDAALDAAVSVLQRAQRPYNSISEVASEHAWRFLRIPHQIMQGRNDFDDPFYSLDLEVGTQVGMQIEMKTD